MPALPAGKRQRLGEVSLSVLKITYLVLVLVAMVIVAPVIAEHFQLTIPQQGLLGVILAVLWAFLLTITMEDSQHGCNKRRRAD